MRHMNKIAASLATLMLAGCAHAPAPVAASTSAFGSVAAAMDGPSRALQFATQVGASFAGTIARSGSVVTLTGKDGAVYVYDFSQTDKTGNVSVTFNGFTTSIPYNKLTETSGQPGSSRVLPLIAVIALDVAFGGAKALAWYWFTHRSDFNKDDAIKATVEGMASALLDFVPYGKYFEWLVPIVVDIISKVKTGDFKEIAGIIMAELDPIIEIIKKILAAVTVPTPVTP